MNLKILGSDLSARAVKARLERIGHEPVVVTINSPGGDAFEGAAIYNLLREHPGKVTVNVIGMAAGAASLIAMAGDSIHIVDGGRMMISCAFGAVVGNQQDMRDLADVLNVVNEKCAAVYAARTKKPIADIVPLMKRESSFSAADAVAFGLADSIVRLPPFLRPQAR